MEVTEHRLGNAIALHIAGRVDGSVSKHLEQKVVEVLANDGAIIVDLAEMNYVSSAGLRSFITLAKRARARNQTVALCGMRDEVAEIFEISGLMELFSIHGSVEAAAAALPR
jgi:anti-anti-sigma factor